MKERVPAMTVDYSNNSLRPECSYGSSSAESTSSYSSSLSSASSSESNKSSFLHSPSNPLNNLEPPTYTPHQYQSSSHTLKRFNSSQLSPPQIPVAGLLSPSSPASSTYEAYPAVSNKFATLSVHPHSRRRDSNHYSNPSASNFRLSYFGNTGNVTPDDDDDDTDDIVSPTIGVVDSQEKSGSTFNVNNQVLNSSKVGPNNMRGVSSFGEVKSASFRNNQYASTPHLFVFQTADTDDDDDDHYPDATATTPINRLNGQPQSRQNTSSNSQQSSQIQSPNSPPSSQIPPQSSQPTSPISPQIVQPVTPQIVPNVNSSSSQAPMGGQSRTLPRPSGRPEPIYSSTANGQVLKQEPCRYADPQALLRGPSLEQDSFAVTSEVVARIETSFRGHKTQIWTCRTMANLYTELNPGTKESSWSLQFTGVPALLLDLGDTKSRDKRRLQILLAEKESGFELWRDTVDNLTSYRAQEPHFHTLFLSKDHRKRIGLSFNEGAPAMAFHKQLESLTADPENISLSVPGKKKKKTPKEKPVKYKPPKKTDISKPCNFHHVTTVGQTDRTRLYSLKVLGGDEMTASKSMPAISILDA